jgi:hypothetical protein
MTAFREAEAILNILNAVAVWSKSDCSNKIWILKMSKFEASRIVSISPSDPILSYPIILFTVLIAYLLS